MKTQHRCQQHRGRHGKGGNHLAPSHDAPGLLAGSGADGGIIHYRSFRRRHPQELRVAIERGGELGTARASQHMPGHRGVSGRIRLPFRAVHGLLLPAGETTGVTSCGRSRSGSARSPPTTPGRAPLPPSSSLPFRAVGWRRAPSPELRQTGHAGSPRLTRGKAPFGTGQAVRVFPRQAASGSTRERRCRRPISRQAFRHGPEPWSGAAYRTRSRGCRRCRRTKVSCVASWASTMLPVRR